MFLSVDLYYNRSPFKHYMSTKICENDSSSWLCKLYYKISSVLLLCLQSQKLEAPDPFKNPPQLFTFLCYWLLIINYQLKDFLLGEFYLDFYSGLSNYDLLQWSHLPFMICMPFEHCIKLRIKPKDFPIVCMTSD